MDGPKECTYYGYLRNIVVYTIDNDHMFSGIWHSTKHGLDWTGQLDWTVGLDSWTGQLDWTIGLGFFSIK